MTATILGIVIAVQKDYCDKSDRLARGMRCLLQEKTLSVDLTKPRTIKLFATALAKGTTKTCGVRVRCSPPWRVLPFCASTTSCFHRTALNLSEFSSSACATKRDCWILPSTSAPRTQKEIPTKSHPSLAFSSECNFYHVLYILLDLILPLSPRKATNYSCNVMSSAEDI